MDKHDLIKLSLPPLDQCNETILSSGRETILHAVTEKRGNKAVDHLLDQLLSFAVKYGTNLVPQSTIVQLFQNEVKVRSLNNLLALLRYYRQNDGGLQSNLKDTLRKWIIKSERLKRGQNINLPTKSFFVIPNVQDQNYLDLKRILDYWIFQCEQIKGGMKFRKEMELLIKIHMRKICTLNQQVARDALLQIIPEILSFDFKKIPLEVQNAFIKTMCECASILPNNELFHLLYPSFSDMRFEQVSKQIPTLREIYRRIIAHMLKLVKKNSLQEKNELPTSLYHVLGSQNEIWPTFMIWFKDQKNIVEKMEKFEKDSKEMKNWNFLENSYDEIKNYLEKDIQLFQSKKCKIKFVKAYKQIPSYILEECWDQINFTNVELVSQLESEINLLQTELKNRKNWANEFIPNTDTYKSICKFIDCFDDCTVYVILYFLGKINENENENENNDEMIQLHKIFLDSWNWIYCIHLSKLFKLIWNEIKEINDIPKIIIFSKKWKNEYDQLIVKETNFSRMRIISPFLNELNELNDLFKSAPGFIIENKDQSEINWNIIELNNKQIQEYHDHIKNWIHLQHVYDNIDNIIRILNCLHYFIKNNGIITLDNVKKAAKNIQNTFNNDNTFDNQNLEKLNEFIIDSNQINECFVYLNPNLFESIVQCMPLLNWLRELTDDKDFKNSIEEAMGKSEMECPIDLWEKQEGKPGRVNEQKLSMLNTVRIYLYGLIYRNDDRLDHFEDLIEILKKLRVTEDIENIINSLHIANQYRFSLKTLLQDESENSVPDRLIQLCKYDTQWICYSDRNGDRFNICLSWIIDENNKKTQNENELLDFQSSIVLAKTDQQGDEIKNAIDKFIQQFGWMRRLCDQLNELLHAGHFDYQNFKKIYSFQIEPEIIRNETKQLEQVLQKWNHQVEKLRNQYYFLNYFTMKKIWNFISIIHLSDGIQDDRVDEIIDNFTFYSNSIYSLKNLICHINSDIHDTMDIIDILKKFIIIWNEKKNGYLKNNHLNDLLAIDILTICAECFNIIFNDISSRFRPICNDTNEKIQTFPSGSFIKMKSVHVLCCESKYNIFEYVLSIYARAGYLPELEYLYICKPTSTFEQVNNLILRWSSSHLYNRENKIYSLVGIDSLSFEIQRKTAYSIKERMKNTKNPLLIISRNNENQHLIAQFTHHRISIIPLPIEILQLCSNEIHSSSSGKVITFSSLHAGAGKTFSIRSFAYHEKSKYIHIPIMNTNKILSTIQNNLLHLRNNDKHFNEEMDYITLHLDLYDTVDHVFNEILFEFIFLGGIEENNNNNNNNYHHDNIMNQQYFWNSKLCNIAIELPYGDLFFRLPVCSLVSQMKCIVNGNSFCTSKLNLEIGMGIDFYSLRNDGTSIVNKNQNDHHDHSNAYNRLKYVCTGLDVMKKNDGRFPFVPPNEKNHKITDCLKSLLNSQQTLSKSLGGSSSSSSSNDENYYLSSKDCFDLIMNVLQLGKPSLWGIWNFINVFYWQLRDMHDSGSPINNACFPDFSNPQDIERKSTYKGEVIKLLIRTAREFATRQIKQQEKINVKGLWITGMKVKSRNGLWERMSHEHEGYPVFRKKMIIDYDYIYYRTKTNQWVCDDEIAASGVTFSFCDGKNMDGLWSTTLEWTDNPNIQCKKITVNDSKAFNNEAIEVSGCDNNGGSSSSTENGIYFRQPPYDNIEGKAHYIKFFDDDPDTRRHLFYECGGWQICPLCTTDEGTYILGSDESRPLEETRWKTIPPNFEETRAKVYQLSEEEYLEKLKISKQIITYEKSEERDREYEKKINKRKNMQNVSDLINNINNYSHLQSDNDVNNDDDDDDEDDDDENNMEQLWDHTLKWNDSNHECLLFSNKTHVVSFLSLDPKKLRNNMNPGLLQHLTLNKINVGENLDTLSDEFYAILSAITEVSKSREEAKFILQGQYCLTGDSLLKMLAIFVRLRCGVPVVLMGECGCGKTMLIKYLCLWMNIHLEILDVHGGTSENDIIQIFTNAENYILKGEEKVFVFLDEINTCSHMGLFCEIISNRSLYGKRISDQIHILAALNPYRTKPDTGEERAGLLFHHQNQTQTPNHQHHHDPMSKLVYRVHPIPHTLRDFIFDFGSLTPNNEKLYIQSMVMNQLYFLLKQPGEDIILTELIHSSQEFIRKHEKDDSSASLRDVKRCLYLIKWFSKLVINKNAENESILSENYISNMACSTILGLSFVYYYRLNSHEDRINYWNYLKDKLVSNKVSIPAGHKIFFKNDQSCIGFIQHFQNFIASHVIVENGIAMNDALIENLFVVIICILTRIPIFVVGKPGSSKTLTMQVIASNLQGKQSPIDFWKEYPAVYIFPYQCSPMSDSHSIQHQFDMAVRYQEHAENTITVLLLDEVGLAEHSPDMPLKVLHSMLVDPPISVVGLSNWVLDPAKMNRAILLQRTEPSQIDIQSTGKGIISTPTTTATTKTFKSSSASSSSSNILSKFLPSLAMAYHSIYTSQRGRDFIGMRDYYCLLKSLRSELQNQNDLNSEILSIALCRNFGGKKELLDKVLQTFYTNCFNNNNESSSLELNYPPIEKLIQLNLNDSNARHLMILTKNNAALPILFGSHLINEKFTNVLIGSEFKDDKTELHLITQINQVKLAMAEGKTLILLNHDNIYEALYDVLNQRYLIKKDLHTGKIKKMLRLAIGSRSQLCHVSDGFKIIVIVEQIHAYRKLDLPLLNRFEKQILCSNDILGARQKKIVQQIEIWCNDILESSGIDNLQDIFCVFILIQFHQLF